MAEPNKRLVIESHMTDPTTQAGASLQEHIDARADQKVSPVAQSLNDLDAALPARVADEAATEGKALNTVLKNTTARAIDLRKGAITRQQTSPDAPWFEPGVVMLTNAQGGGPSIYWPYVVRMEDKPGTHLNKFYMYFSTDHDNAGGGIYLAHADHPEGPWTSIGMIYRDTAGGTQTETPVVLYVPEDLDGLPYYMYYQQENIGLGNQSTLLARSADGITWTRHGIVIQKLAYTPGDGHEGYAHVHRVGNKFVAHHLDGGGDWGGMSMSWSHDGIKWHKDPRRISARPDITGDNGLRLNWHSMNIFKWRGETWGTFGIGGLESGLILEGSTGQFAAPLAPSLRDLAGNPVLVADDAQGQSSLIEHEGTLYAYYRAGGPQGNIYVSKAAA